jgi:hypothetical protein
LEKTCPSASMSINPTWSDQSSNLGHHGGKPATNHLSYGMAYHWSDRFGAIEIEHWMRE